MLRCHDSSLRQVAAEVQEALYSDVTIGRNALLLSLIIDEDDNKDLGVLWNIYYDIYLTKTAAAVLEAQLEKLLAIADTLETWSQSRYGEVISFCEEGSLSLTREFWSTFGVRASLGQAQT